VLGPEKLPRVVSEFGRWVGRARAMARQFREQLEEEVQLEEARKAQPPAAAPTAAPPVVSQPSPEPPQPQSFPHAQTSGSPAAETTAHHAPSASADEQRS
jgi:sec-independent protein translocase protein TatB